MLIFQPFVQCQGFVAIDQPLSLFFDQETSFHFLIEQVNLGPRIPGSTEIDETRDFIVESLGSQWSVSLQNFTPEEAWNSQEIELVNLIATRKNDSSSDWIILGAHHDTRRFADSDPDPTNRSKPVPGANDGASGVAVLLELAEVIEKHNLTGIILVFFDGEDQGRIDGWPWIVGSSYYVSHLTNPNCILAVIIIDMIGDSDLQIYKERNSYSANPALVNSIWEAAEELEFESSFIQQQKYSMLDDHTPFLDKGIPAVDLIDFDYFYWHTIADTVDKTNAESLGTVGQTIELWLLTRSGSLPTEKTNKAVAFGFSLLVSILIPIFTRRLRR